MNAFQTVRWDVQPDLSKPDLGLPTVQADIRELYSGTLTKKLGAFALHPHITFYDGTLFAFWSVHFGDEDSPGQYIRYAVSEDFGESWSDPSADSAVLFPPMEEPLRNPDIKDADGNRIRGCRPHENCGGGVMSDISWENDLCGHFHLMLCANGFALAGGNLYAVAEAARCPNRGIGRVARRISKEGLGDIFWLGEAPDIRALNPRALNTDIYANDAYDKTIADEIIGYLADARHMPQWDMTTPGWVQKDGKTAADWGREFAKTHDGEHCGEPTAAYRAADGTFIRFWRNKNGIQNVHYSVDCINWSLITDSGFPDTGARTSVGNLPDGRVYAVGNPGYRRMQLCLSLSDDGYLFNDNRVLLFAPPLMKHAGRAKGTGYHYPHSTVAGKSLFVIFSRNKEDILVARISIKNHSDD